MSKLIELNFKMASLFHEEAGPQKYGEYVFEWLPLLQTPCYGFSGPNACYSTTCNHNPSLSKEPKLPNSTKMSFKFYMNAKKSLSNCERAADHTTYKSTLAVQMNAHGLTKRNTYEEDKPKFNGYELVGHYPQIAKISNDYCFVCMFFSAFILIRFSSGFHFHFSSV